jgi:putative phage-type endonuclease
MTALELAHIEQGSEEWIQARVGLVTASRCADVCAMKQNGEERSERARYRSELICEILTGIPYPQYESPEMRWGREYEKDARAAYEMQRGVLVDTCGFIVHPEVDRFGASPDGLVGDDGLIQIKCPTLATHLNYWLAGTVPEEHCPQMLGEMSCTGRDWDDFVSYHPFLPEHLQLFVIRFARDNRLIGALERNVNHFNREIDGVLAALPQKPQGIVLALEHRDAEEVEF